MLLKHGKENNGVHCSPKVDMSKWFRLRSGVCLIQGDLNSIARVGQLLERYTHITQTYLGFIRLNLHLYNRPLSQIRLYHLFYYLNIRAFFQRMLTTNE